MKQLLTTILVALLAATLTSAAPAQATKKAKNNVSEAQKAMDECSLNYCGYRSSSVTQARAIWIENCFRQKMGRSPAEMGIAVRIRSSCQSDQ